MTNVFFTDGLPHDLLSKGLNLLDVFVAPSYYAPPGQLFLEALAKMSAPPRSRLGRTTKETTSCLWRILQKIAPLR